MIGEFGTWVVGLIEAVIPLRWLVAGLSVPPALICVWLIAAATSLRDRLKWALLAGSLALSAATPFVVLDPPWLAQLVLAPSVAWTLLDEWRRHWHAR